MDASGAEFGKSGVDQDRYGLIGGGPLGVAAPEDGVWRRAGALIGRGVVQPGTEMLGVRRRRAVVRRADQDARSVLRQVADMIIEGAHHHRVAAFGALLGQPGRDALRRAQVGAVSTRRGVLCRSAGQGRRHFLGRTGFGRRSRGRGVGGGQVGEATWIRISSGLMVSVVLILSL